MNINVNLVSLDIEIRFTIAKRILAYVAAMQCPPNFSYPRDEDYHTSFQASESELTFTDSYQYSADNDTLESKTVVSSNSSTGKLNIPQFTRGEESSFEATNKALNIYHGCKVIHQADVDFLSPVKILTDILSCKCSKKIAEQCNCLGDISGSDKALAGNFERSVNLISMLRSDIINATETEKRRYIENLLSSSKAKLVGASNRFMVKYSLCHVNFEDNRPFSVCRACFCVAMGVTEMNLKTIKAKVKAREECSIDNFRDTDRVSAFTAEEVKRTATSNGCPLTRDQENMLIVSRSSAIFIAINWMERYFKLVGDVMPNTNGEIHLESCQYRDLYDEYLMDMENAYKVDNPLTYSMWRRVWKEHFSHVRVREYKQVTGKCDICEIMSEKRKSIKTAWGRQLVTECHAFHR